MTSAPRRPPIGGDARITHRPRRTAKNGTTMVAIYAGAGAHVGEPALDTDNLATVDAFHEKIARKH